MIVSLALQQEFPRAPRVRRFPTRVRTSGETVQMRLNIAAKSGDVASIGRALSEPVRRLDLDHPLRLAAKGRHRQAVRFLLERGANLVRAFSVEHAPARAAKRHKLVEFLASCGADGSFILAYPSGRAA